MQFALLIYESPEAFAARKSDGTDPYTGAPGAILLRSRTGAGVVSPNRKSIHCRVVRPLRPASKWVVKPYDSFTPHHLDDAMASAEYSRMDWPTALSL